MSVSNKYKVVPNAQTSAAGESWFSKDSGGLKLSVPLALTNNVSGLTRFASPKSLTRMRSPAPS